MPAVPIVGPQQEFNKCREMSQLTASRRCASQPRQQTVRTSSPRGQQKLGPTPDPHAHGEFLLLNIVCR